jgi:aldehyde dehydrogenase (NAD+)
MQVISDLNQQHTSETAGISELVKRIYAAQQAFFRSGATKPYAFRKKQLLNLMEAIKKNEDLITEALYKDLRKPSFEAFGTEIGPTYAEIKHTLKGLRQWMQPQKVETPLLFFPSSSTIIPDPLGIILTIGPWNYPFLLMITPLISAIAGGNTAILKPSDEAIHTGNAIHKIIQETFEESYIAVIQCPGPQVGSEMIEKYHFDHIFFTGSVRVGKLIMEMAAKHLSPVTLELGGKSPCIIDKDVNLDFAARKVAWSKLINAGQTCVAPDYLLVHEQVKDVFIEKLKSAFQKMLGDQPQQSPDFGRMINKKRYQTVSRYLSDGKVVYGGETDEADLYIAPTILEGVKITDAVMQEEIFGPVLPVITYSRNEEVLDWIEKNPYPLALYVFTSNRSTGKFFMEKVRFGGGCINNAVIHLGNPDIPFGGVGTSGIGQYHGKQGFDTFTRPKSIMKTPTWFDAPLWYAPYKNHVKWIKLLFKL